MITDTLSPLSSTIKPSAWLAALALTLALHLVFFISYPLSTSVTGAPNPGPASIEVGLRHLLPSPMAKPAAAPPILTSPLPKPLTPPKKTRQQQAVKKSLKKAIATPQPVESLVLEEDSSAKETVEETVEEMLIEETITEEALASADFSKTDTGETEAMAAGATALASTEQVPAGSGNPTTLKASYEARLAAWLARYKRYPPMAKRRGQEDLIELEFTIDPQGKVLSHRIINPSPYKSLNRAVIKMITRASPLPAIPTAIQGNKDRFTFIVPVIFELQ